MLLLPAVHLFSPWLNNLEIEIVCSHPSSSSFICMNRKENLGFHCNAIHKSLLESITLISSYSTTKKTRKNKNKGEPSMWLLSFAASRLLTKSPWLLRVYSIFVTIPIIGWLLSSFNNEEKKGRSNVMICSLAHQKTLTPFGNKPAQTAPARSHCCCRQVNTSDTSVCKTGHNKAVTAS